MRGAGTGRLRHLLPAAILLLSGWTGCKPPEEADVKAIVGAVLIDGTGGPPVSNSVLLIAPPRIAQAGARTNIAIPQGAAEIDGSGKFMIPTPIDIYLHSGGEVYAMAEGRKFLAGVLTGGMSSAEVRRRIGEFAADHRYMAVLDGLSTAAEDAALEESRKNPIPVFARVSRLADARRLVEHGAAGFIGMIADTADVDADFIGRMRDLGVVWAPDLAETPPAGLDIAKRNTRRLAAGGVPIAVGGEPLQREMELLVEAGLAPGDAIVAGTRNGARVLGKSAETGTLQRDRRADLLLLSRNPIEDIRNLNSTAREMRGGAWVE